MTRRKQKAVSESNGALAAAQEFVGSAGRALEHLSNAYPEGMCVLEQALAARVRAACARLLDCATQLAEDELMILGSTGQRRPHPMLKSEQELRKEIASSLGELDFRVEQRAMLVEAKRLTARPEDVA